MHQFTFIDSDYSIRYYIHIFKITTTDYTLVTYMLDIPNEIRKALNY